MRTAIAALGVVIGFILGVFGIAHITPDDTPAWIRLTLVMLWMMALIAGAFLLGNQGRSQIVSRGQLRDGLIYVGIASVIVAVIVSIGLRDIEYGRHRNYHENWIVCVMTAGIAGWYTLRAFWSSRRSRRLWLVLVIYLTLHFSILIPTLGKLGHVPGYYISLIGMCEMTVLLFVLSFVLPAEEEGDLT